MVHGLAEPAGGTVVALVATSNVRETRRPLFERLRAVAPGLYILVGDDESPDCTG